MTNRFKVTRSTLRGVVSLCAVFTWVSTYRCRSSPFVMCTQKAKEWTFYTSHLVIQNVGFLVEFSQIGVNKLPQSVDRLG